MKFISEAQLQFNNVMKVDATSHRAPRGLRIPTTNLIAEREQTGHDINQESGTQSPCFMTGDNAKSSEQCHWSAFRLNRP